MLGELLTGGIDAPAAIGASIEALRDLASERSGTACVSGALLMPFAMENVGYNADRSVATIPRASILNCPKWCPKSRSTKIVKHCNKITYVAGVAQWQTIRLPR